MESRNMFNQSSMIRSIETGHEFVCFKLKFVDPLGGLAPEAIARDRIPLSAIHMVQRGSGLRSALYFRIENVTYDRMKHDDHVVRAVLKGFIKDLFDQQLADHMPALSPHSNVDPEADDESLDRIYDQLARAIWNAVTSQRYNDPIVYTAGGFNTSRLNVSFGNGLSFIMSTNKGDLYRAAGRLSGTVVDNGTRHHFAFFHSELPSEDLEGLLTPDVARKLLEETLDRHAPMFRGIKYELHFAE
jgi:hypothetical protein